MQRFAVRFAEARRSRTAPSRFALERDPFGEGEQEMLKHLEVNNFKAWRKLDMELGKVTGLFGTNSSGKSSVLQFLLLLKQTKDATDRGLVLDFGGPNELVNLGTYQAIVHRGDQTADMDWTLDWDLSGRLKVGDPTSRRKEVLFEGSRLRQSSRVGLKGSHLSARYARYEFLENIFAIEPRTKSPTEFDLRWEGPGALAFIRNQGRGWPLPGPVKTHLFPDQAYTYFQNTGFLSDFEAEYEALMDDIFYLGPLREHPQREYRWSGASPYDVGPRGERTVDAMLAATAQGEELNLAPRKRYMKFQEMIAYWLRELGLIHSFHIKEIGSGTNLYQACVRKDQNSPETMLTDVGFGVSQVLPVLVLLYYVPEGSSRIDGTARNPSSSRRSKRAGGCDARCSPASSGTDHCRKPQRASTAALSATRG